MKNFLRLVRYAWPYRVRFFLSLVCAVFVALLWSANIGAVYPLLTILFNNQNCRRWVADQIVRTETDLDSIAARAAELEFLRSWVAEGRPREALTARYDRWEREARAAGETVRRIERELLDAAPLPLPEEGGAGAGGGTPGVRNAQTPLVPETRNLFVLQARLDEIRRARDWPNEPLELVETRLDQREARLRGERDEASRWLGRYRAAQPFVNKYTPDDGFQTLLLLMGLVFLGVLLKGVFQFLQEYLVASVTHLTLLRVRNRFYRRTLALDLKHFSDQGSAELMTRFTTDIELLGMGFNLLLGRLIREPLRAFSCLGAALWFNWRLTLLALVVLPVSAVTTVKVGRILKRAVRRTLESMSSIYKHLQETFQGVKVVKAYSMERAERARFYRETKRLYRKSLRVATIDAMSDPVLELLALTTVAIALLSGAYLVLRGTTHLDLGLFRLQLARRPMTLEDLLTLYAMLAGISDPVRKLANVHSRIQRAAAASDRICASMDREPSVVERAGARAMAPHRESIEFDDVSFAYDPRKPVLNGLSFTVKHGERVALVGPNGCGKSTLTSLLARFHDPDGGAIRIDGVDLRDLRIADLRRRIGLVTQETVLFQDTVERNIAYGCPDATRERVVEAARLAHADAFVSALPDGYDTMILEGGKSLSGGQRQRLALARVMLRDPDILVLDEATSAIDIEDENLIRQAIERFARGRTTFIIAHSLKAILSADRIVLINNGKVEGVGTHHELHEGSPLYRRLHTIHFEGLAPAAP